MKSITCSFNSIQLQSKKNYIRPWMSSWWRGWSFPVGSFLLCRRERGFLICQGCWTNWLTLNIYSFRHVRHFSVMAWDLRSNSFLRACAQNKIAHVCIEYQESSRIRQRSDICRLVRITDTHLETCCSICVLSYDYTCRIIAKKISI